MGKTERNGKKWKIHATKVTKIPKTKIQKYGTNETLCNTMSILKGRFLQIFSDFSENLNFLVKNKLWSEP